MEMSGQIHACVIALPSGKLRKAPIELEFQSGHLEEEGNMLCMSGSLLR
jgi:hypothetical protein